MLPLPIDDEKDLDEMLDALGLLVEESVREIVTVLEVDEPVGPVLRQYHFSDISEQLDRFTRDYGGSLRVLYSIGRGDDAPANDDVPFVLPLLDAEDDEPTVPFPVAGAAMVNEEPEETKTQIVQTCDARSVISQLMLNRMVAEKLLPVGMEREFPHALYMLTPPEEVLFSLRECLTSALHQANQLHHANSYACSLALYERCHEFELLLVDYGVEQERAHAHARGLFTRILHATGCTRTVLHDVLTADSHTGDHAPMESPEYEAAMLRLQQIENIRKGHNDSHAEDHHALIRSSDDGYSLLQTGELVGGTHEIPLVLARVQAYEAAALLAAITRHEHPGEQVDVDAMMVQLLTQQDQVLGISY